MDEMLQVKTAFDALLKNISKERRRLLYQQIGRELARNQRRRIKAQQNPDGSAFEPRKNQKVRSKKGRIKAQAMFKKLGTARFMRTKTNQQGVNIGYRGANAHIANVHQYGLKSRVRKNRDYKVQYAQRELLGFTEQDREMIEDFVLKALAEGT